MYFFASVCAYNLSAHSRYWSFNAEGASFGVLSPISSAIFIAFSTNYAL